MRSRGALIRIPGTKRSETTRRRGLAAAALAVAVGLVVAACGTPPPPPADPYDVRTSIRADSIDVSWDAPADYAGSSYEVQWYTPETGWTRLPQAEQEELAFAPPLGEAEYHVRVRSLPVTNAVTGGWSPPARLTYVDLELPVVRIDTQEAAPILDRENYVPGTVQIDPNGSGFAAYSGTAGIRGRGNSTWAYDKKPYRIKLDKKSPILGLAAEKDWALLANAVDESQLRNYLATEASRLTGLDFTPTMRHVEVVLNGQYAGVYTLTEHNEVGPDRVDIAEMDDSDVSGNELTGGYRLEIDGRLEENREPGFRTAHWVPVVVKDPDPATPEQMDYIRGYLGDFESALYSSGYADPDAGYRAFLDIDAFVDHFLVQELTRNQDAFLYSTFITKDRGDDKLRFGPIWDFDNALGNDRGVISDSAIGDHARNLGPWNLRLFTDPALHDDVARRWQELRPAFVTLPGEALLKGAEIAPAVANDLLRWRAAGIRPNDEPEFLAKWLNERIAWMDTRYPAPEV